MTPRTRPARLLARAVAALLPLGLLAATGPASAAPDPGTGRQGGTAREAGPWRVAPAGAGGYEVSWRSPSRFPVTSDRPTIVAADTSAARGLGIGAPTVRSDGRTVTALVRADRTPSPGDFDVLLSGDRLDVPGDDRLVGVGPDTGPGAGAQRGARRAEQLAVDPGVPGDLAVVSSDYELEPVKLPGMRQPIEMVGHVVEPAPDELDAAAPLVLFQHGRHSFCYKPPGSGPGRDASWPCQAPFEEIPSHLGYDYVQRLLASQGYVTVSVRVNGINAQDFRLPDGGADARAAIVRRHLDHWTTLAAEHQVDLEKVVLVGHSRGGEGVDRASIQIPADAPYRVAGQVLIAPTDFGSQTAPYVPTVTLLPYCDGDVSDLQGQRFTDYSRDLLDDDTSLKSSVLVDGANHNYFNTEWTPGVAVAPSFDDWFGRPARACGTATPRRLSDAEQRDVGAAYVAGAVRLFTGQEDVLAMFDGSTVDVPSTGDAVVRSHALGGGREVRRPSLDAGLSLADGARTSFCSGATGESTSPGLCGRGIGGQVTPHWTSSFERTPSRRFLEMSWDAAGQSGGMLLSDPLDLTRGRLELRTLVDPRVGDVAVDVRLTDAEGRGAVVVPEGGPLLPALPPGRPKIWGQALLVDPTAAADAGVDTSRVTQVELVSRNDAGRVWVADLAAAPSGLAPVPDRRAATLDLGRVEVPEGDGPGTVTAQVPFAVTGLDRPGRAVLFLSGQGRRAQRYVVDLAPGQREGTIPISYDADDLDDRSARRVGIVAYALRGLVTDSYVGGARVVDDDPTPAVEISAPRRVVPEGRPLRVRVRLAAPVGYAVPATARVLRSPRPQLAVDDVRGLRDLVGDAPTSRPLSSFRFTLGQQVERGRTSTSITLPTVADRRREGRESVRLAVRVRTAEGLVERRLTLRVRDR